MFEVNLCSECKKKDSCRVGFAVENGIIGNREIVFVSTMDCPLPLPEGELETRIIVTTCESFQPQ